MDISYYQQYEPIFGSWKIVRLIGEGSFGKVFEIQREDFGVTYKAALKAITIPQSQSEVREILSEGMDDESARTYFSSLVKDLVNEFALMSKLKGNSNIVSYENHQVIEHKDGIGWDILIQMELLTPLNSYLQQNPISQQDVIKLGIDLCKALELCQKYNIIHRDIKPENIFISNNGDFKLGDFGVARTAEKTTSGMSKKGTYTYMAPEVYKGEAYGTTVDIYSLGIVLYRLLNGNRMPFLPPAPALITYDDREKALVRRLSGEPLPPPVNAKGRLADVVRKACAFRAADRYSRPEQLRQDLESLLAGKDPLFLERPLMEESSTWRKFGRDSSRNQGSHTKRAFEGAAGGWNSFQQDVDGKTVSNFGNIAGSGTKSNSNVKNGGESGEKTVSNFGSTTGDRAKADKDNKISGGAVPAQLIAQMLPACGIVPLGPNQTTYAISSNFSEKEKKFVQRTLAKYGLQNSGEILGYCGVITNINIPYAFLFTETGVIFPCKTKVSRFMLDISVQHRYVYLPYQEIQGLSLCTEKKLLGISFSLSGGNSCQMILPQDIYVHRTNVCKLIQALCGYYGNSVSFLS
ncbi:MAG: serine/threonine protein kinase [Candidatus Merdivicinus sp.]|jgi:serine/threonine protein kinase